jgi:hypothetical protein
MNRKILEEKLNNNPYDQKSVERYDLYLNLYDQSAVERSEENYAQAIASYKNIIKIMTLFLNEMKFDDELDIFNLYSYLLWNGYFSINKEYCYSKVGLKKISGYYGMDIMTGKGVCLANSDFLVKVLKEKDLFSMILTVYVSEMEQKYQPNISRNIKQLHSTAITKPKLILKLNTFFLKTLHKLLGNHALVLIEKNGHYYAVDPTNLCVFKVDDYLSGHIFNGNGSIVIKQVPLAIFNSTNQKEIDTIISSYKNVDTSFLTDDYVKAKSEDMLTFCKKNGALFDDLHLEIRDDIKTVDSELKQYRK